MNKNARVKGQDTMTNKTKGFALSNIVTHNDKAKFSSRSYKSEGKMTTQNSQTETKRKERLKIRAK